MVSNDLDLVLLILTSNIVLVVDFEEFIVCQTMITDGEWLNSFVFRKFWIELV